MVSVAPFVATPLYIVRGMLKAAEVGPYDVVYDLGSGDGRVLIEAVQEFEARQAIGIELRKTLVEMSREKISKLGLNGRVEIIHDDLFNVSVKPADVVTFYLTPNGNRKIKPKLERELKPGSRVVSRGFGVPGWKPAKIEKVEYSTVYIYQR